MYIILCIMNKPNNNASLKKLKYLFLLLMISGDLIH